MYNQSGTRSCLVYRNRTKHNHSPPKQDKEKSLYRKSGLNKTGCLKLQDYSYKVVSQNRIKNDILSIKSGLTTTGVENNSINTSKLSSFFRMLQNEKETLPFLYPAVQQRGF